MCQDPFDLLKKYLAESPIFKYPDPEKPNTCSGMCLNGGPWSHHRRKRKEKTILHPITYVNVLFRGSQLNWAAHTKKAYTIYMSV